MPPGEGAIDLGRATAVVRSGTLPAAEQTAAEVLASEIAKRTGIRLPVATSQPAAGPVITITGNNSGARLDGYRLSVKDGTRAVISIEGTDARGALYGVGQFLRRVEWGKGRLPILAPLEIASAPVYATRGHQLGYRTVRSQNSIRSESVAWPLTVVSLHRPPAVPENRL